MKTYTVQYLTDDCELKFMPVKGEDISEALEEFMDGTYYKEIVGVFKN
jgi:hypothetical protein